MFTVPPRDLPEPQPRPSSEAPDYPMINNDDNDWEEIEGPVEGLDIEDLEPPAAEGKTFQNESSFTHDNFI